MTPGAGEQIAAYLEAAINLAIAEEREACAKIAETEYAANEGTEYDRICCGVAAKIRARE